MCADRRRLMYATLRPFTVSRRCVHVWSDRCTPPACTGCGRTRPRRPSLWMLAGRLLVAAWFVLIVVWLILHGERVSR
jgi:hypothetical protein